MLRIEIFSERREALGEGPLWDVQEERLSVLRLSRRFMSATIVSIGPPAFS